MPLSSFSLEQIIPLYIAAGLLFISMMLWPKQRTLGLLFLVLGAFGMSYFVCALDPFLMVWDEQYHAMVGKNMSTDFFTPMLYDGNPVPHDPHLWIENEIWLHKQPFFLWQIALSIKIFGPSVMAVRLPSMILFSILPFLIYRIGKIAINENTGYLAGLLFSCSYFALGLSAGHFHTDHNDLSFLFYLTASFWAWFEYQNSNKKYWLILIGVFSGFAVLTKWLMGLLVYVIWFLTEFFLNKENRWKIKTYIPLFGSELIAVLIFLPWQIYILNQWPEQANYEFAYNSKHFFEPVEGHAGTIWYHFQEGADYMYGSGDGNPKNGFGWFDFLLTLGLISLLFKVEKRKQLSMIMSTVVFIYLFYSIAETKMPAFTVIAMPFLLLGAGTFLDTLFDRLKEKWKSVVLHHLLFIGFTGYILVNFLNIDRVEMHHSENPRQKNPVRESLVRNHKFVVQVREMNLDENYLIFNTNMTVHGNIPIMFFTGLRAYDYLPKKEWIPELKSKNYKIAVMQNGDLPDYIKNDPEILIIQPNE
ncbi:MAG: glycosyltransferase family 39 protein [Crocinitomicaceae bacterium]|nr:glycosyltransferase family 39 protein [Crocinitomicaceae bacterium]